MHITKEIAQKGGQASGKARLERKHLKEDLLVILDIEDSSGEPYREKIAMALITQACKGNTRAFEVIRDTIGEKPVEQVAINQPNPEVAAMIDEYVEKFRFERENENHINIV